MKRMVMAALLLLLTLLLAGCAPEQAAPENGQPGYASCAIDLTTDGRRVFLLQRGRTLREWSSTFTAYEVTGGGMRRIVSGRDADDLAVAEGTLYIASHTANWLKPMQDSAELDGYGMDGGSLLHVSARDEKSVNPDFYAFRIAGEQLIRRRKVYTRDDGCRQEFALVDAQGSAGEPFYALPYTGAMVTDTYIVSAAHKGSEIRLFDLKRMQEHVLPVLWGRDESGQPVLPQGVLLAGVLYYPAADGIHAYDLAARQDSLFAAIAAPEYFYACGGQLYTVADDGLLTVFDLQTGASRSTGVALTKADRYVIAGESVYILQTPELHGVRKTGCRIETLEVE